MATDRRGEVPDMPTSATTDAISDLIDGVDGKLIDRSRVVDSLLDLRLLATDDAAVRAAIDDVLGSVPGRTLVDADWYVDALGRLASLGRAGTRA